MEEIQVTVVDSQEVVSLFVQTSTASVLSVNGNTGVVVLTPDDLDDAATTNKFTTAANLTKLGFVTVTQAVNLDTMESDITTNNAKVGVTTEEENTINTTVTGEPTGSDLVLNVVSLTQAEYTAGTPVATTFYIITDA